MDLIDKLQIIAKKISDTKDMVNNEEATKNAYIVPFFQALGYDTSNPLEFQYEYTATFKNKQEKIDYCVISDKKPVIAIECKHWEEDLDKYHGQLKQYFAAIGTKFGILTNGIEYRFYADLNNPNVMDDKPFFELFIDKVNEAVTNELKKFTKNNFQIEDILSTANELKYLKEIKELFRSYLTDPDEDFVRHIAQKIYPGSVRSSVMEMFDPYVRKAGKLLISEIISEKLTTVIETSNKDNEKVSEKNDTGEVNTGESGIITTEEELEAFRIIKAVCSQIADPSRIGFKDYINHFNIILDNKAQSVISRLYFNTKQKYIGLYDGEACNNKVPIEKPEEIYKYAGEIINGLEVLINK